MYVLLGVSGILLTSSHAGPLVSAGDARARGMPQTAEDQQCGEVDVYNHFADPPGVMMRLFYSVM